MKIKTEIQYVNPGIVSVTTSHQGVTRIYTINVEDAQKLYPMRSVDDSISRMARKLFKDDNDSCWFTGYE